MNLKLTALMISIGLTGACSFANNIVQVTVSTFVSSQTEETSTVASTPVVTTDSNSGTATLDFGGVNLVTFNTITPFNMNFNESQSFNSVKAFTIKPSAISITLISDTPSDAGNPQMRNQASSIPYTVSFKPCYQPGKQPAPPTYQLEAGIPQIIPMPYSQAASCNQLLQGQNGAITFTRLPLAQKPAAGIYIDTLTFAISEI